MKRLSRCRYTSGVVLSIGKSEAADLSHTTHTLVRIGYTKEDGKNYESFTDTDQNLRIGDTVPIRYDDWYPRSILILSQAGMEQEDKALARGCMISAVVGEGLGVFLLFQKRIFGMRIFSRFKRREEGA